MGGNGGTPQPRSVPSARAARSVRLGAAALVSVLVLGACDDDEATVTESVGATEAMTAIITWQAAEQEPVLDADGEPQLPVIFVVAADGAAIDVGVQADVAAAVVDTATVRFADDVTETFDSDLDGEPVRDDGVMLLVGPMPDADRAITVDLDRYYAVDDYETLQLEITAAVAPTGTDDEAPTAAVTAVTRL